MYDKKRLKKVPIVKIMTTCEDTIRHRPKVSYSSLHLFTFCCNTVTTNTYHVSKKNDTSISEYTYLNYPITRKRYPECHVCGTVLTILALYGCSYIIKQTSFRYAITHHYQSTTLLLVTTHILPLAMAYSRLK